MSNIFETGNGVLQVAPTKISGKYKVVVNNDNLFLDDFLGRQIQLDNNNEFLPQVANFLSTETIEPEPQYLKYGNNHNNKIRTFTVPLYLGDKLNSPKYFVIYNNNRKVVKFVDLTKVGLTNIFNEINEKFDYPLTLDFDDSKLTLIGYSIPNLTKKPYSFNILESLAKQNKLEYFNNLILNSYQRNKLFYPKFINLEFVFDYNEKDNNFDYEEFTGYLSYGNEVNKDTFNVDNINISVGNVNKQVVKYETYKYEEFVTTSTITNITNKQAEVRFRVRTMSVGDELKISINDVTDFNYIVQPSDIKPTLYETVTRVCNSATKQSYNNYVFKIVTRTLDYIEISIINSDDSEDARLDIPNKFQYINNQKHFISITDNDYKVYSISNLDVDIIKIDNKDYLVEKSFIIDNIEYVRLNKNPDIPQGQSKNIYFYKFVDSKIIELLPITYFSVDDELTVEYQYNPKLYIEELKDKFINNRTDKDNINYNKFLELSKNVITDFENKITVIDKYPYTKDIINNDINNTISTVESNNVVQTDKLNDIVLKLMFNSVGHGSYINPNVLNFDKRFWESSLSVNPLKTDNDYMRFNWFLIKSEAPNYLSDRLKLRYFTDKPKLTSRIINFTGTNYCETLFLGVKYVLPVKYKDYNFAVYLDFEQETELDYNFELNHIDKTLYLVINKFVDFIDLIRGGNKNNPACIDLSLFYNVQNSYNSESDALYSFKTGGILFCDSEIPVMFENELLNDWKIFEKQTNKWYICLKRSRTVITDKFTNIFPRSGDSEFFVYSTIEIDGEKFSYISVKFKIKNIRLLNDDYVWCEDLEVEFYDTNKMFVFDNDSKIYNINDSTIFKNTPRTGSVFSNYESDVITTIVTETGNQTFNIINYDKVFSFKEYYFEITRKVEYSINGTKTITDSKFTFPENIYNYNESEELVKLMQQFERGDTFDQTSYQVTLSLFERNQIWNLLRELINVDIKFKHTLVSQTRRIINNLLVSNLIERVNLSSIPTNIPDENIEVKINQLDNNVVVWKDYITTKGVPKINQIYRHRGIYLPYLVNSEPFKTNKVLNRNNDFTINVDWVKSLNYLELVRNNITGIDGLDLLNKYYQIKYITNEFNQRLDYFINADNQFIISFNDLTTYHERFNKLYLTFERK